MCSTALQGRCCAVLPCKVDVVQYCLARKNVMQCRVARKKHSKIARAAPPEVPHRDTKAFSLSSAMCVAAAGSVGLI